MSINSIKACPQNQFTPPKPFRKIILMTDDNFSIYNTTSILGEIMIFFSINLSISLHTDFFPLWMREIEIMAMKMWLANHLLEYTKFSKPFSLFHHLIGTMGMMSMCVVCSMFIWYNLLATWIYLSFCWLMRKFYSNNSKVISAYICLSGIIQSSWMNNSISFERSFALLSKSGEKKNALKIKRITFNNTKIWLLRT